MRERFIAFIALLLLAFFLVLLRCWDLQIRSERLFEMKARRNQLRIESVPARRGEIRDRHGRILATTRMVFDAQILDPSRPMSPKALARLSEILGMPETVLRDRMAQARQTAYFLPLTLKRDIGRRTTTVLLENRVDLPEVLVTSRPIRHYPNETFACHVLGHLGRMDPSELKGRDRRRDPDALIGKAGLEKVWEKQLCGRPGAKSVLVDVFGWPIEERLKQRPVDGKILELTLDLTVQTILERALEGRVGAVVVVDPATGDVLGMASYPNYDPNLFTRSLTTRQWAHLSDPDLSVLLNRTCETAYQPGSTFKIVTAMAALRAGIVTEEDRRTCTGSFQLGKRTAHCWRRWGHGEVNIVTALAKSCNVFFYGLGVDLEEEIFFDTAHRLGLGATSGLGLPGETEGVLPDRRWRKRMAGGKRPRPFTKGDMINVAIGQGEVLVTPLQMAMVVASVANEGKVMKPRLLERLVDKHGKVLEDFPPRSLGRLPLKAEHLALVRKGLKQVVKAGTARRARMKDVEVFGKTGSAQNPRGRTHAWFVGVMESRQPDIALAVLLENAGSGGGQAVPLARQILGHIWGYLKSLGVKKAEAAMRETTEPALVATVSASSSSLATGIPQEVSSTPALLPATKTVHVAFPVATSISVATAETLDASSPLPSFSAIATVTSTAPPSTTVPPTVRSGDLATLIPPMPPSAVHEDLAPLPPPVAASTVVTEPLRAIRPVAPTAVPDELAPLPDPVAEPASDDEVPDDSMYRY